MLTKSQLQTCVHFIRQAAASLEWCRMMFFGAGDSAARLHEIVTRLSDEAKAEKGGTSAALYQSGDRREGCRLTSAFNLMHPAALEPHGAPCRSTRRVSSGATAQRRGARIKGRGVSRGNSAVRP